MLSRKVLRQTGAHYFERCQIFSSFFIGFSVLLVFIANSYVWTCQKHNLSGMALVVGGGLWLLVAFMGASHEAAKLQALAGQDRMILRREG